MTKIESIVIRNMTTEDIEKVTELGYECFDQKKTIYRLWTIDMLRLAFETNPDHCFVAMDGGVVAGFSIGAEQFGSDTTVGFIRWTGVRPTYQGAGLGTRLFSANVRSMIAKHKTKIITDIETSNIASELMVKRLGFQIDFTMNYWAISSSDFFTSH